LSVFSIIFKFQPDKFLSNLSIHIDKTPYLVTLTISPLGTLSASEDHYWPLQNKDRWLRLIYSLMPKTLSLNQESVFDDF